MIDFLSFLSQCDLSCGYFSVSVKLSVQIFIVSVSVFSTFFPFLLSLTELNSTHYRNTSISAAVNLNHIVAMVCVIAGIMQTNCTTRAVRPKTENFMTYTYIYIYACVRLRRVHGVSSYNVSDGCRTKTEMILVSFSC